MLPPSRHPEEDPSLQGMSDALRALARAADDDHLSEAAKARQRADLLALASSMPTTPSQPASTAPSGPASPFRRWRRVLLFASGLAVCVLALNLAISALPGRGPQGATTLATRLLIPASQSAQAFTLEPAKAFPAGMDPVAGWVLRASVPVSRESIERALTVDPPVALQVEKAEDGAWRLMPDRPLVANTVYRVTLAAALEGESGETPYAFHWADQTVGEFRVEGLSPAPAASYVPADAAIEWTFSHAGFVDPAPFVEIVPAVKGRFETRDRVLAFLPERPLVDGQVYGVTLKAGFGLSGTPDMRLKEDVSYKFQVADAPAAATRELYLPTQGQIGVGKPFSLGVTTDAIGKTLRVEGFALSAEEALAYLRLRGGEYGMFSWGNAQKNDVEALIKDRAPAFTLPNVAPVSTVEGSYGGVMAALEIPGRVAGFFLLRVNGAGFTGDLSLVQVTDVAVHAMTDRDNAVVWAVDARTRQPIEGATVAIGDRSVQTGPDGLARVALPDALKVRDRLRVRAADLAVEANGQKTLVALEPVYLPWWYASLATGDVREGNRRTWSALYADRRVQRGKDTISLFGLALDRSTKRPPSGLKLLLAPSSMIGASGIVQLPVYEEQDLVPDANGRFQASFSWERHQPGWYQIQLLRDGNTVDSLSFEIRADAKPRLAVTLEMKEPEALMGDTVVGTIKTAFVDGTPFPNVELQVTAAQSSGAVFNGIVKTDEFGQASIAVKTNRPVVCAVTNGSYPQGDCYPEDTLSLSAQARTGEEAESSAGATVRLHTGSLDFAAELDHDLSYVGSTFLPDGRLQFRARVRTVTVPAVENAPIQYTPAYPVQLTLYRQDFVTRQTGTEYDEVNKRTVPIFQSEPRLVQEAAASLRTDAGGLFEWNVLPSSSTAQYIILARVNDPQGRSVSRAIWTPWRPAASVARDPSVSNEPPPLAFAPVRPEADQARDWHELALNQRLELALRAGDGPLPEGYSKPLFVVAGREIGQAIVASNAELALTFDERLIPNVAVYGIVFTERGFRVVSDSFYLGTEPYGLKVTATPDRETYAPSSTARLTVSVKDATDRPVAGAKVAVSVADNALASLGAFGGTPMLGQLYRATDQAVERQASTHLGLKSVTGGAEGGGGGVGDILFQPRTDFRDQAAFVVVETGSDGIAIAEVRLPDNITTWRIEAVALSRDLRAGEGMATRPATKELAVDAVLPRVLLVGDQAELKLRPIAESLATSTELEYAVDAPSLGIAARSFKAKGRENVYVPFTVIPSMVGKHVVRVGVSAGGKQDAMELGVEVIAPAYTKTVWEEAAAVPGLRLPETLAPESTVVLTSPQRAALLRKVQGVLSQGDASSRLEGLLAARLVSRLLPQVGGRADDLAPRPIDASVYQDRGWRVLPQSSVTLDASLEVALSGEALGDREALIGYLNERLFDKAATREARVKALAGLAALGEPVLPALRAAATQTGLSLNEQSVLIRAFVGIGARAEAKALLDPWLDAAQDVDGGLVLRVGVSDRERFEATRVSALAAAFLGDPRTGKLYVALDRTVLADGSPYAPILDAQILTFRVEQAPHVEAKVTYRIGSQTQEVSLKDGPVALTLPGDGWPMFSIDRVEGAVTLQWNRRVPGIPASSPGLAIERSYRPIAAGPIREGETVEVVLKPSLGSRETFGCYEIRDRLPANLRPILDWRFIERGWSPAWQGDGEARFTACSGFSDEIRYTAQVVAPGTYLAPAPILQNMDTPSLASIGREATVVAARR